MTPVDWTLGMVSILLSLALGDIALSFHRLMRYRRTIHWDVRVPIAACLVIQTIIRIWFLSWNVRNVGEVLSFPFYIWQFAELMLLFLLAAGCLPDRVEQGTSLTAFYDEHRRYFWTLFGIYHLSYWLHFLYFVYGAPGVSERLAIEGAPLLLMAALALVRAKWLQIVGPLALLALYLVSYWSVTLAAPIG